MQLTQEVLEKIDKEYHKKWKEVGKASGLGVNVKNSFFTVCAFRNNFFICELDELTQLIDELLMMREAIKEATGIIV